MCSSPAQVRPAELLQQSTQKWQQSSIALWRRSTTVLSHSRNKCHQTTVEAWHRSADTWVNSKTRCRQSTADVLVKSANKWHQTAERFYQNSIHAEAKNEGKLVEQPSEERASPTSTRPTPSPTSSHSSQSPTSPTSPSSSSPIRQSQQAPSPSKMDVSMSHMVETKKSIDVSEITLEKQVLETINLTDQILYRAASAKQLKEFKPELLGEIEYNWIFATISDAGNAARDLAKFVEPYRLELLKHKGKLKSSTRKRWILKDSQLALERRSRLDLFQERLERSINHLTGDITPPMSPRRSNDAVLAELPQESRSARMSSTEVPNETRVTSSSYAELPARSSHDSDPASGVAELPGDGPQTQLMPLNPVPRIIVTQAPGEMMLDRAELPDHEQYMYEAYELDGTLHWDETRDNIRMQQSESLANIVAKMDLNRTR
ncbi:uncharacterized protein N7477_003783 [Penicillium maclennaniae]|uniref:uncharacterized protein n=1 Tax=Penicillium maclennaniae TaxID=1343394 RepID=UPI0025412A52|nr:uncharacterized protein N7477_003783 [Penicillium maclennaniae]KAJ5678150.1 hypothetical protein N7477_003783 [Penicillium maclennaniae]